MFEAELKARIRDVEALIRRLRNLAIEEESSAVYDDQYFDTLTNDLKMSQRELRVRRISKSGQERYFLTAKLPPFESTSRSKPEFEVQVSDGPSIVEILKLLGYVPDITLVKECRNYRLRFRSYNILATIARIHELPETFLEVETLVRTEAGTEKAFNTLRALLTELQIPSQDITNEYYTDAVRAIRSRNL